jgi:hypothetical protein
MMNINQYEQLLHLLDTYEPKNWYQHFIKAAITKHVWKRYNAKVQKEYGE